jgi:hypothetical protein
MSGHTQHPISLGQLFFTRSVVIATPGHEFKDGMQTTEGPENTISLKKAEGPGRNYIGTMRSVINPTSDKASPYTIDMECVVQLTADDSLSEDEAYRGCYITAHSVLFGAIREAVAWITGRQAYGPLMLGLSILKSPQKAEKP